MDANKWLSTLTFAGIFGLIILHAQDAATILDSIGKNSIGYVQAVQAAPKQ